MADDSQRPIVVKRIKKVEGGAHGGSWKIAYADFVTAMMAFFLLMWLLGSTAKGDLQGIAEYFQTPLKTAMFGGSGSGDASHVIKGGGKDLTRSAGQVKQGEREAEKKTVSIKAAEAELARLERARLRELKGRIEAAIDANPLLEQFKRQLLLDMTSEGLRIQIVDEQNRPMFESGRAELLPHTRTILREIGLTLNEVDNRLSLAGHTDATPYSSGEKGYSNWELSADRANASRRELLGGGMADGKMLRVVGLGSAVPFDRNDPHAAVNRRISLLVLNKKTEDAIRSESGGLEVGTDDEFDKTRLEGGGQAPAPEGRTPGHAAPTPAAMPPSSPQAAAPDRAGPDAAATAASPAPAPHAAARAVAEAASRAAAQAGAR